MIITSLRGPSGILMIRLIIILFAINEEYIIFARLFSKTVNIAGRANIFQTVWNYNSYESKIFVDKEQYVPLPPCLGFLDPMRLAVQEIKSNDWTSINWLYFNLPGLDVKSISRTSSKREFLGRLSAEISPLNCQVFILSSLSSELFSKKSMLPSASDPDSSELSPVLLLQNYHYHLVHGSTP
ncbi:hypothetical protein NQ317_001562 [Molorchus minor]|uniref:Uncharacterized protein n=1 Tax=Molorchus minor TaxID=1323400 RepID=A0ABQ9J4T4_9CUCU|nr:hypothetical protein NQ317_001562 [Molorchus minor]